MLNPGPGQYQLRGGIPRKMDVVIRNDVLNQKNAV